MFGLWTMKVLTSLLAATILGWFIGMEFRSNQSSPPEHTSSDRKTTLVDIFPVIVSTDTLESFTQGTENISHNDLALWLLDASPDEIALLWSHFSKGTNAPETIANLILNAWARHAPVAVVTATRNTPFTDMAWRAFAIHHPEKAYEEALAVYQDAARTLGSFRSPQSLCS